MHRCQCDLTQVMVMLVLLRQEDYRKITVERRGEQNFFTSEMIKSCMKKVVAVNLHQTVQVQLEFISHLCILKKIEYRHVMYVFSWKHCDHMNLTAGVQKF